MFDNEVGYDLNEESSITFGGGHWGRGGGGGSVVGLLKLLIIDKYYHTNWSNTFKKTSFFLPWPTNWRVFEPGALWSIFNSFDQSWIQIFRRWIIQIKTIQAEIILWAIGYLIITVTSANTDLIIIFEIVKIGTPAKFIFFSNIGDLVSKRKANIDKAKVDLPFWSTISLLLELAVSMAFFILLACNLHSLMHLPICLQKGKKEHFSQEDKKNGRKKTRFLR